ncbi:MAG: PHP domain-containing protein [Deltaproteobacteria bacterium]|nr:PHP domain-containing protein [Deltaproteobacteria bacterium]
MQWIDLHTHSNASDGALSPAELVAHAQQHGLEAVALTDHDTVDGLDEALQAGTELGLEVVPGLEISVGIGTSSMHLLGYFLNHHHPGLMEELLILQKSRAERNPQIVRKLNDLGMGISLKDLELASGGGQIGRLHIASVLKGKGYVNNFQEAFDLYLKKGQPAHVDKFRFDPETAFAMIHSAGGVSVVAHPFTLTTDRTELETWIRRFKTMGLSGIEAYYSDHTTDQTQFCRQLALKYDLVVTGGSDFHGANKPGIEVGVGRGSLRVPYSLLEKLKVEWSGRAHVA